MATFLLVIHLIVCFFLITIVLIQGGKGAELGAAFGGSSQTLFGARGAATFFSKLTTTAAIIFMLTSFALSFVASRGSSVVRKTPATEQKQAIPQGATGPLQGVQPSQPAAQPQTPAPAAPAPSKK
jgi:preprotein translocase subunit SecG